MKNIKTPVQSFTTTDKQVLEASYLVSLRISQTGKPHTIGETLIIPVANDLVTSILGQAAATKLDIVSLSNNTVFQRIGEMAAQVKEKLIQNIKQSRFFAIKIDENTDLTNFTQLMAYIRFEKEQDVHEEFLFYEPLPNNATASEIFKKLNEFMTQHDINLKNCMGVCSDAARAMVGFTKAFMLKLKNLLLLHIVVYIMKRLPQNQCSRN